MTLAALAAVTALPAAASAANDGSTCSYTNDQDVHQSVGNATVYADVSGNNGGMTGTATAAAGACLDNGGTVAAGGQQFDGGSVEAGVGSIGNVAGTQAPVGAYAIVDGDNDNKDQLGQGDGYFGVSNYETSWPPTPPQPGCGGDGADHAGNSNSGGCVGLDAVPVPVPGVPIACGNTSGHTWSATTRDGCSIP